MNLFDYGAAQAAKQAGMKQSKENANEAWTAQMLALVLLTCKEQLLFTADEVFDRYDALPDADKHTTHDRRAFGPVMMKAAKLGYCEKTDRVRDSVRSKLHKSPIAIWRSKLYVGK